MTKTILVAEDDRSIMRLVQINLERQGYRVVTAFDGREALAKMAAELPELVVTDIMMPYVDGLELVKILKKSPVTCDIPIIMLTAKAMEADIVEGWKSGVDCYLTKPISPVELIAFVQRILEAREEHAGSTIMQL